MDKLDKVGCIHSINLSAATEIDFMKKWSQKSVQYDSVWYPSTHLFI